MTTALQPPSPPIDHFIVASNDADALESQFIRLGFTLRPRSLLTGAGSGLCNRGIFLEGSRYIELLSVVDPGTQAYGVPEILAIRSGLIRLALQTTDILGARRQAIELGYGVDGPVRHRVAFDHQGQRFEALCEVFHATRPETPTLGCYFVDYLQEYDTRAFRAVPHENGVVDARAAVVVGLPAAVQPYQRLMGGAGDSTDAVEVLAPAEWEALTGLPAERSHSLPYLAGIVFTVASLPETERWMARRGINPGSCGERLMVHPAEAGNTTLFFEQKR